MPNPDPPTPQAQLAALLADEATAKTQLAATPLFEADQRRELNERLTRLNAAIARHCARHGLARPT